MSSGERRRFAARMRGATAATRGSSKCPASRSIQSGGGSVSASRNATESVLACSSPVLRAAAGPPHVGRRSAPGMGEAEPSSTTMTRGAGAGAADGGCEGDKDVGVGGEGRKDVGVGGEGGKDVGVGGEGGKDVGVGGVRGKDVGVGGVRGKDVGVGGEGAGPADRGCRSPASPVDAALLHPPGPSAARQRASAPGRPSPGSRR